jgi:dUTP pyrophosphatase
MIKGFVDKRICMPSVANTGDAGLDLKIAVKGPIRIRQHTVYKIPTSLYIEIPLGKCGVVLERSGLGSKGISILGRVIDSPYRGQICVLLQRSAMFFCDLTRDTYPPMVEDLQEPEFKEGDKIAQMLILNHDEPLVEYVKSLDELTKTERGEKGFGSSDKK